MSREIDDLINKITSYESFSEAEFLLHDTVLTMGKNYVTQVMKANAEFQYKLGLSPKIVRSSSGNCCKWCDEVAGVYQYPDVPRDVYRRHRGCTCSVDYYPGDGKVQNVHSRKKYEQISDRTVEKYNEWMAQDKLKLEEVRKNIRELNERQKKLEEVREDITVKWLSEGKKKRGSVKAANGFLADDGTYYKIDGRNVKIILSDREREVAHMVKRQLGAGVEYLPDVNGKYRGVHTADYLINGEKWDLKEIKKDGKDVIRNAIHKRKQRAQAHNFIIDISKYPGNSDDIFNKIDQVFYAYNTKFIEKIMIVKDGGIIKIYKRK